jgi:hypothetical protein
VNGPFMVRQAHHERTIYMFLSTLSIRVNANLVTAKPLGIERINMLEYSRFLSIPAHLLNSPLAKGA